jgi:hypothetical protein
MSHQLKHSHSKQQKKQKGSQGMKHEPLARSTHLLNRKKKQKDSQGMKHESSARSTHQLNRKKSKKAVRA